MGLTCPTNDSGRAVRIRLSPGRWEACSGIWPERVLTQSKLYSNLLQLDSDMQFSACPSSIGRLLGALRCLSGGPLFARGDADADGVLSAKTDMHAN